MTLAEMRIYVAEDQCECTSTPPFTFSRETGSQLSRQAVQLTAVQPLFSALSRCSALHESLLPDGTPNNFFGLADDSEDDEEEEEDEGEIGRVRSDFQGPDARYRPY